MGSIFNKPSFAPKVALQGKQAIVTGAGGGSLGYATAKTLAKWGALVIVTSRTNSSELAAQLSKELADEGFHAQIVGFDLDLREAVSVKKFALACGETLKDRLDILVNNAGVHLDLMSKWNRPKLTEDGHEIHWRTNYLGTAHLTELLLPLLRKTGREVGEARVVNVGSQVHVKGQASSLFDQPNSDDENYNSWQAYGTSKLAMILHAFELQRRYLESDNLKAFCLHPGGVSGVRTKVADKGLSGHTVMLALKRLGSPLERLFMASPEEGAQTQIFCATSIEAESGQYYQNCSVKSALPIAYDASLSVRLWNETFEWLSGLS